MHFDPQESREARAEIGTSESPVAASTPGAATPNPSTLYRDKAPQQAGKRGTRPANLLIDIGMHTLDVMVDPDVDLDSRFRALCNDTGETLFINGWLIDSVEPVEAAA